MTDATYEDAKRALTSIPKYVAERLRLPIVVLYLSLVVLFNWDVLLYLTFQKSSIICKIQTIKTEYYPLMYYRLLKALGISIVSALLLPSLQIAVNWIFGFVKKYETNRVNDLELSDAEHQKLVLDKRTGNLERQEIQAKLEASEASRIDLLKEIDELNEKINTEQESTKFFREDAERQATEIYQRKVERRKFLVFIEQTKEEIAKYVDSSGKAGGIIEESILAFLDLGKMPLNEPFVTSYKTEKDIFLSLSMFLVDIGLGVSDENKEKIMLTKYGEIYRKFHHILNDEEVYPVEQHGYVAVSINK